MLKILSYVSVILYLIIFYGQNLFEFGSDIRIGFYFIGMSLVQTLIGFILFKSFKNLITSYYLFMCIGDLFNQSFYMGNYSYIELMFGLLGIIYILLESKIKKLWMD